VILIFSYAPAFRNDTDTTASHSGDNGLHSHEVYGAHCQYYVAGRELQSPIGAMVDAAIVVVENTHKRLARWREQGSIGDYRKVMLDAVKEVAGPSFFSLLVIAVSFHPRYLPLNPLRGGFSSRLPIRKILPCSSLRYFP
jgi:hypothetical protein